MKHNRLKHCTHVLCHMFRGWRLHSDWATVVRLGAGKLKIDVLTEKCWHDGNEIPTLTVAKELRSWLLADLEAHHIPLDRISEASLEVKLESGIPEPTPSGPGVPVSFYCQSQISTDETVYNSTYADEQLLIVSPDALNLEKQEKDDLLQASFRTVEARPRRGWRLGWPFRRR